MKRETFLIVWWGLLTIGLLLGRAVFAQEPGIGRNHYLITSVSVYDGDTLTADIHLGLDVVLRGQRVRLAGYDAWELTRHRRTVEITDEELAKGEKAKEELIRILAAGTPYLVLEPPGRDAYGRLLARLMVRIEDGGVMDAADQMRHFGHDRDYQPPKRKAAGN